MAILTWLWRALLFFALFAFALNNQDEVTVRWVFGAHWHAPLVFVVLAAFAFGTALGVVAMVPSWWRHRRAARRVPTTSASSPVTPAPEPANAATEPPPVHPPREGL